MSRRAFAKHDVVLAEVGRWCNLLDADPVRRAANLKNVSEGLALAEALGARCCVDIAGSYNAKSWFGPHPQEPVEGVLRRQRGERPKDHRLGAAHAGEVLLRDDGLGAARQPRRLSGNAQGGGSAGLRRSSRSVQCRELARSDSIRTRSCWTSVSTSSGRGS